MKKQNPSCLQTRGTDLQSRARVLPVWCDLWKRTDLTLDEELHSASAEVVNTPQFPTLLTFSGTWACGDFFHMWKVEKTVTQPPPTPAQIPAHGPQQSSHLCHFATGLWVENKSVYYAVNETWVQIHFGCAWDGPTVLPAERHWSSSSGHVDVYDPRLHLFPHEGELRSRGSKTFRTAAVLWATRPISFCGDCKSNSYSNQHSLLGSWAHSSVSRTCHQRCEWQLPAVTELTQEGPSSPGIVFCPGVREDTKMLSQESCFTLSPAGCSHNKIMLSHQGMSGKETC